jgi:hypothetical protein
MRSPAVSRSCYLDAIDAEISQIIHRPMTAGHAGECIGAHVFDMELESMPRWRPMTAISARGLWLTRP